MERLQEGDIRRLVAANGKIMNVKGNVDIPLNINGLTVVHTFLVLPYITQDLILGVDFLTKTEAKINFKDRTLTLYCTMTWLGSTS